MDDMPKNSEWIERTRQKLQTQAEEEREVKESIRSIHEAYSQAIRDLFDEIESLANEVGLRTQKNEPKQVQNTLLGEYFQVPGDLTVSFEGKKSLYLIPGDLTQNLAPAAFSGIGVLTKPSGLLPFDELFYAEKSHSWVIRENTGRPTSPHYETKSITPENLIERCFLKQSKTT